MATDLLSLIGSYKILSPDSDSALSLSFLKSIEEQRTLQQTEDKTLKSFQAAANSCVSDHDSRLVGLQGLLLLAAQSPDDFFGANSRSWTAGASQHIKASERPAVVGKACEVISAVLRRSSHFSELSRHLTTLAPNLVFSMVSCADVSAQVPKCILRLLAAYPGSCGQAGGAVEKMLIGNLVDKSEARFASGVVCEIYSVMPRLGGGGRDGVHHKEKWSKQFSTFVDALHNLAIDVVTISPSAHQKSAEGKRKKISLDLPKCPSSNLLKKAYFYAGQFAAVAQVVREMLRSFFPCPKKFSLRHLFGIFELVFAPSLKAALSSNEIEGQVLSAAIPKLWSESLRLLIELIAVCREDVIPRVPTILNYCLKVMNDTKSDYQSADCLRSHEALKLDACRLVKDICHHLGASSGFHLCSSEFVPLLLKDVVPFRPVLSLMLAKGRNKKGGGRNKKGTGGGAANRPSDETSSSSPDLCSASLRAVDAIFTSCGALIDESIHKNVQCVVIGLCMEVQQNSSDSQSAPYKSAECRLGLYRVLKTLLLNYNLRWPSPLGLAVQIFKAGCRDEDRRVAEFCVEAGLVSQSIAQPRSATLHVEMAISAKDAEEIKTKMMHVHTLVVEKRMAGPDWMGNGHKRGAEEETDTLFDTAESAELKRPRSVAREDVVTPSEPALEPMQKRKKKVEEVMEDDIYISAEKQEEAMKMFYDFSGEAVVIPEEVRNRPRRKEKEAEVPDKQEGEEEESAFDVEAALKTFVNEESSDDDDNE
jgi:hypothetical protein